MQQWYMKSPKCYAEPGKAHTAEASVKLANNDLVVGSQHVTFWTIQMDTIRLL